MANFFQGVGFNLFLHFPGFLTELGASSVVIGWLSATMALTAIAVRPAIGQIMDSRGRRGLIVFGSVLNVVVTALYLTVDHVGTHRQSQTSIRIDTDCSLLLLWTIKTYRP